MSVRPNVAIIIENTITNAAVMAERIVLLFMEPRTFALSNFSTKPNIAVELDIIRHKSRANVYIA